MNSDFSDVYVIKLKLIVIFFFNLIFPRVCMCVLYVTRVELPLGGRRGLQTIANHPMCVLNSGKCSQPLSHFCSLFFAKNSIYPFLEFYKQLEVLY